MEELTSFAGIPTIMFICYYVSLFNSDSKLIVSVGLLMGVICYYVAPNIIHSDNVLTGGASGIASALASLNIKKRQ